jgi:hypothetical protein
MIRDELRIVDQARIFVQRLPHIRMGVEIIVEMLDVFVALSVWRVGIFLRKSRGGQSASEQSCRKQDDGTFHKTILPPA